MRAVWNGITLAESAEPVLLEGNVYFPPDSVRHEHLRRSRLITVCPWKGIAGYYSVEHDGARLSNAAWIYRRPFPWIRKIRRHVAFDGRVEIVTD